MTPNFTDRQMQLVKQLLPRLLGHPRVLEILADCADDADAEQDSFREMNDSDDDLWLVFANDMRMASQAILAEDPDLWEHDYPAEKPEGSTKGVTLQEEDLFAELEDLVPLPEERITHSYNPEKGYSCYCWTESSVKKYAREILQAAIPRIGANVTAQPAKPREQSLADVLGTDRIASIAESVTDSMPDGILGFCKTWGWQQFAQKLLEAALPRPQTVWLIANKTSTLVFSSKSEADKFTSSFGAAVAGGFHVQEVPVIGAVALPTTPELIVGFGSMPESNGRENWTVRLIRRKDIDPNQPINAEANAFQLFRSEFKDRMRYEADCLRFFLEQTDKKPNILDYDADLCSDFAKNQREG